METGENRQRRGERVALGKGDGGQRKVFRDSAIANLSEFFSRFDQLNVRSNPDLDRLVAQAQELVQGVKPQDLRDNDGLRASCEAAETRRVASSRIALMAESAIPVRRRRSALTVIGSRAIQRSSSPGGR